MENKYAVNSKIISDTYNQIRQRNTHEYLRIKPYILQNIPMNAIEATLLFLSWTYPKKVIGLHKELQKEGILRPEVMCDIDYYIGSGDPIYDIALTCAEAIKNCIQDAFNINLIKRVLAIGVNQKKLEQMIINFNKMKPEELEKEIDTIIASPKSKNRVDEIMIFLYLWANGIYTEQMGKYLSKVNYGDFYHNNRRIIQIFDLDSNFVENEIVQKCIETTKRRLLLFVNKISNKKWESVELFIKEILQNTDHLTDRNSFIEFASVIDCFEYFHMLNRSLNFSDEYISNTIHSVLICYIQTCFELVLKEEDCYQLSNNFKIFPSVDTLLSKSHFCQNIFIYLNQFSESSIIASCIWAIKLRQVKGTARIVIDNALQSENRKPETNNQTDIRNLKIKTNQLEEKVKYQDAVILSLRTELRKLRGQTMEQCSIPDSEELKYRRKYNKAEKNVARLEQELLEERERVIALEEKITSVSRSANKSIDYHSIDTSKKYLFVVDDDRLASRLKVWFPKSILSDHAEVSPRNANNFYMGVFFTSKITHVTYKYYKEKCILFKIPIANCNGSGYASVCSAIKKCEMENNLNVTNGQ